MTCPICHKEHIGRLSKTRYFCSDCFLEFFYSQKSELQIFRISEDGSTHPVCLE